MVQLFQTLHTLSYVAADRVTDRVRAIKSEEKGASAVEYAVLVGLIVVALVAIITAMTGRIGTIFGRVLP